jgi:hypothetical protein
VPTVKVPFNSTFVGVDAIEVKDKGYLLTNAFINEVGSVVKRPAIRLTGISPTYGAVTEMIHADSDLYPNRVYLIDTGASPYYHYLTRDVNGLLISNACSAGSASTVLPRFAADRSRIYGANSNGAGIVTIDDATTSAVGDADAPDLATHIQFFDGYILALYANAVYFSYPGDGTNWAALDYFSPVGDPDNVHSMLVHERQLYLFGTKTIEIWQNDGTTPFSRVPGGYLPYGCFQTHKPHAVVDGQLYFFDQTMRLLRISSNKVEEPPGTEGFDFLQTAYSPYYRILNPIRLKKREHLLISDNQLGNSYVYDPYSQSLSKWTVNSKAIEVYGSVVHPPNINGSGDTLSLLATGNPIPGLHKLDSSLYQDTSAASVNYSIDFRIDTGHVDYGTLKNKRSEELRIRCKRTTSGGTLSLTFTDDGEKTRGPFTFSLGSASDTNIILKLPRTGIFRTRQYSFSSSSNVPLIIADAEEDIEVLRD